MAVLHEYVPSSEKEGYYIYDAYDGVNVTYQVSSLARRVFDRLDSCMVDEQLPGEVFHTLHRLGFVYTRQSEVEQPDGLDEIPTSGQSKSLSTTERRIFFNKLLSSNNLGIEKRREIKEYADQRGIKTEADLHGNWVPSNPGENTFYGEVTRTFQSDEWGFITSDEVSVGEDIFFHINELESMTLLPGMSVEFAYDETTDGFQAFHVKRLTDTLGREIEEKPEKKDSDPDTEPEKNDSDPDTHLNRDHVGISGLSEGDYVEAQIDHAKGQKGLGRKGYLHIHHRRESSEDYLHISNRNDSPPVNKWVVVQVTAIQEGYAEATIKSAPADIDPPLYLP
ncbi:cold-shock protein [Haloplanus salinarum]|uniref:cold-shock protein n=1 Tax=Haloplanus salinarum TaxID=1912324 RepID=UPI00214B4C58|nr:cold shock domain-containing protein [Haloplanus salinarum]